MPHIIGSQALMNNFRFAWFALREFSLYVVPPNSAQMNYSTLLRTRRQRKQKHHFVLDFHIFFSFISERIFMQLFYRKHTVE